MLKKLFIAICFISQISQSQNLVTGELSPSNEDLSWVAVYYLKGAKQIFIKSESIEKGKFSIEIPKNSPEGMYRLIYQMDNKSFVNFIYTNENIDMKFDPNYPSESIEFLTSAQNKLHHSYSIESNKQQFLLDSLQYSFFKLLDEKEKKHSSEIYKSTLTKYNNIQQQYSIKSKGKLINHFIKANRKYYSQEIFKTAQEYLNSEKKHYFDFIDFTDNELINSTFITESVLNYVFYFNVSDDIDVQEALHKKAVNEVMEKIGKNNLILKSEIIITLANTFSQKENIKMIDYLSKNFYEKLPNEVKKPSDMRKILENVRLAVGRMAPDFSWEEKGKKITLTSLDKANTYILAFWSTTCSHCLKEIPKLYEFTKSLKNVHVIGFAIENDDLGFKHYATMHPEWTNILGLKKWENPTAKLYKIVNTPTYFILDANKKIIAKPDYFKDIKAFFKH